VLNPGRLLGLAIGLALALVAAAPTAALSQPSPPLSFLVSSTDQLGYPGQTEGTEVTPEGDLFTGWAELDFTVGSGHQFDPITHSLALNRYPFVRLFRVDGSILYQLEAFQTSVAGRPVTFARIQATNLGSRTAHGRVRAAVIYDGGENGPRVNRCCLRINRFPRPRDPTRDGFYWQPGVGFNANSVYALQGTTLIRDGQALVLFPHGGRGVGFRQQLQTQLAPFDTRSEWGRATYTLTLPPHQSRALSFTMPVETMAPTDPHFGAIAAARYEQYRSITLRFWRNLLRPVVRISVPESKVVDTFYASIVQDALARYVLPSTGAWVQAVNQLRYHEFFLRDSTLTNEMYLLVGVPQLVRQNLDFVFTWQRDDGLFIDRADEYDGFGQALWTFGEYVRRTGDAGFAHQALPAVARAMAWFDGQRASDPLGLMPPVVTPPDNELTTGHISGDNFWAAAGAQGAVEVAQAAGDQASAARWQADHDAFVNVLRQRVFLAQQANHGYIPPTLDNGTSGNDWGNLWSSYPTPVIDPNSAVVLRTIAHVRRKFREGITTWAGLLHGWLGFRLLEEELLQGRQRDVVEGLYSELAHTTGTNAGFETSVLPLGDRVVDDTTSPHGTFAAEYATLLRNMLVREQGSSLYLMSAVSPYWLRPGQRIALSGAPTTRGRVSFTLTSSAGGATLRWSGPWTRLVWPVPYLARDVSAPGLDRRSGVIVLHGRSGSLHVRWRLAGQAPTYFDTFRHLMILYFNSQTGAAQAARARGAMPLPGSLRGP
jgi:hypothetical protein